MGRGEPSVENALKTQIASALAAADRFMIEEMPKAIPKQIGSLERHEAV